VTLMYVAKDLRFRWSSAGVYRVEMTKA